MNVQDNSTIFCLTKLRTVGVEIGKGLHLQERRSFLAAVTKKLRPNQPKKNAKIVKFLTTLHDFVIVNILFCDSFEDLTFVFFVSNNLLKTREQMNIEIWILTFVLKSVAPYLIEQSHARRDSWKFIPPR